MSVFIREKESKRVIFNVEVSLAERLEKAKEASRVLGRKLDADSAVDKALEKFLKKAEKKLQELLEEQNGQAGNPTVKGDTPDNGVEMAGHEPQTEESVEKSDGQKPVQMGR